MCPMMETKAPLYILTIVFKGMYPHIIKSMLLWIREEKLTIFLVLNLLNKYFYSVMITYPEASYQNYCDERPHGCII